MKRSTYGFTLIELSIVLVIIGLIVGGVLVGRDLINAAEIRSQISQIEKYNTAVHTFRTKYNCLPGDCTAMTASALGLTPRGQYAGEGDGNGLIQGVSFDVDGANSTWQITGETGLFWVDLSSANLIDGNFHSATANTFTGTTISGSSIDLYLPKGKFGNNYLYVFCSNNKFDGSDTPSKYYVYLGKSCSTNVFGLSAIQTIDETGAYSTGSLETAPGMSPTDAYNIDTKIDDGMPTTGMIIGQYLYTYDYADPTLCIPEPCSLLPSSTTCYDNAGGTAAWNYTRNVKYGRSLNCGLSIAFQ